MATLSISYNREQMQQLERLFAELPREIPKVLSGALNDAAKSTRTNIIRLIREKVVIKRKDIARHVNIERAKRDSLEARIVLRESRRLSLSYFGARQVKARGGRGGGLTYRIRKDEPRAFIPGGFLVPKTSLRHNAPDAEGHIAFKRRYKSRLPIDKLRGPSAWGVFVKAGLDEQVLQLSEVDLEKHLGRRVNFTIMKMEGRIGGQWQTNEEIELEVYPKAKDLVHWTSSRAWGNE